LRGKNSGKGKRQTVQNHGCFIHLSGVANR
jgi:hypothetical protein